MSIESTSLSPVVNNPPTHTSGPAGEAICDAGSPRAPANKAELRIKPSRAYPRRLSIDLAGNSLWVCMANRKGGIAFSHARDKLAECYLDIATKWCQVLYIGNTGFFVCDADVAKIRATFEPHGLRIRETDS